MEYSSDSVQSCPSPFSQKNNGLGLYIKENDFKLLGFKSNNSEVEMDHFKYCLSAKKLFDRYPQNCWIHVAQYKTSLWKRKYFNHLSLDHQQHRRTLGSSQAVLEPWQAAMLPPSTCGSWGHDFCNPIPWQATWLLQIINCKPDYSGPRLMKSSDFMAVLLSVEFFFF